MLAIDLLPVVVPARFRLLALATFFRKMLDVTVDYVTLLVSTGPCEDPE